MKSLKVNPEYRKLVPRPTKEEYRALEADMIEKGEATEAIIVNKQDVILDGHTRYEICLKHGLFYRTETREFDSELDEKIYVIEVNLNRRQLGIFQKIELLEPLEKLYSKKAEQKKKAGITLPSIEGKVERHGRETVSVMAKKVGTSRPTYERAKYVRDNAPEELKEKVRKGVNKGGISISRAYSDTKKIVDPPKEKEVPILGRKPIKLHHGDFIEVCNQMEPESVDYIITDPPYGKEYVAFYEELGKAAARVLKKNGSLIAMSGQSYLPEIMNSLSNHLTYNWTVAYLTPGGQSTQLWQRKVNTFWKPLLWYVKDEYDGKWIGDVTRSKPNDNDKRFMGWQQSESGMADIIERFTEPEDIILDPFMGSGTTGWAALNLNRQFIGIEIDQNIFETASKRLGVKNDS